LFAKVALALMLGKPAAAYLDRQRSAHLGAMARWWTCNLPVMPGSTSEQTSGGSISRQRV
jgi:hypothetical protein